MIFSQYFCILCESFAGEGDLNTKMCKALLNDGAFERLSLVSHQTLPEVCLRVKLHWMRMGDKLRA